MSMLDTMQMWLLVCWFLQTVSARYSSGCWWLSERVFGPCDANKLIAVVILMLLLKCDMTWLPMFSLGECVTDFNKDRQPRRLEVTVARSRWLTCMVPRCKQQMSAAEPMLPPCRICSEKASGFHYGANTCEACKVRTFQWISNTSSIPSVYWYGPK